MSAVDAFEEFVSSIPPEGRARVEHFIASQRADLLASRSEDARLRVTSGFMQEVNELLHRDRKRA